MAAISQRGRNWTVCVYLAVAISYASFCLDLLATDDSGGFPRPALVVQGSHHTGVTAIATSSDGKLIVTGDADGKVVLWESATGLKLGELVIPGSDASNVRKVGFSPDGTVTIAETTWGQSGA